MLKLPPLLLIYVVNRQAFPSGSGPLDRTTYMFTYVEPQPTSPTLEELLEDYWDLMPKYQVIYYNFIHSLYRKYSQNRASFIKQMSPLLC